MKKIIIIIISSFILFMTSFIIINQNDIANAKQTYKENETEFRAAWISYYTGDINYKGQQDYMDKIDAILDTLEYYNMNAMIFHIRANHDAWYNSKINKINSQLANVDFDIFDPLEYVITEAHKRGIEFHAWLNPYRLGSTYGSKDDVAAAYSGYPNNPASNPNNVLIGSPLQILDPGIPEVREFIVDTCMEIVENYDIDAIHFDDYFYANGIDDSITRTKYNTEGLSIANFRRKQVDTFIYNLKLKLDEFNSINNRFVQLGISPTGVYKNANSQSEANTPIEDYVFDNNGNLVYPIGATTGCQMHYESYLYCDTLKWINNEWINYILPQTYWAQNHSLAPFERLINWWNQAVSKKNVNLYSGMGLYMWSTNTNEAYEQLGITSNLENVKGTSIYSYKQVAAGYNNADYNAKMQMNDIRNLAWKNKTILPKVKGFDEIKLGSVNNFLVNGNSLSFDRLDGAKFYIIYKDTDAINYDNSQIVDIIGGSSDIISWKDTESGNFIYDVIPISYTNTLGEPTIDVKEYIPGNISCQISINSDLSNPLPLSEVINLEMGKTGYLVLGNDAPSKNLNDYTWSTTNSQVVDIDENGSLNIKSLGTAVIEGKYKNNSERNCKITLNIYTGNMIHEMYTVRFLDSNNKVLKEEKVKYGTSATPPTNVTKEPNDQYQFTFKGWNNLYYNIVGNIDIIAVFEPSLNSYHVIFKNPNGEILKEEDVLYGHSSTPPTDPTMDPTVEYTYRFSHWDADYTVIKNNITITAVYNKIDNLYQIRFETNGGTSINPQMYFHYEDVMKPSDPIKEGFLLDGWYYNEELTEKCVFPTKLTKDTTLYAKWVIARNISFYDDQGKLLYKITVKDGSLAEYHNGPNKNGYNFVGWSLSKDSKELFDFETVIHQDYSFYACYEVKAPIPNYYVVTFYDFYGNIIKVEEVEEGKNAIAPEPLNIEGYQFKGWDKTLENVTSDLNVHPLYETLNNDSQKNCSCKDSAYFILTLSFIIISSLLIYLKKKSNQ